MLPAWKSMEPLAVPLLRLCRRLPDRRALFPLCPVSPRPAPRLGTTLFPTAPAAHYKPGELLSFLSLLHRQTSEWRGSWRQCTAEKGKRAQLSGELSPSKETMEMQRGPGWYQGLIKLTFLTKHAKHTRGILYGTYTEYRVLNRQ